MLYSVLLSQNVLLGDYFVRRGITFKPLSCILFVLIPFLFEGGPLENMICCSILIKLYLNLINELIQLIDWLMSNVTMFLNHYTAELDHSQWYSSANFCFRACALALVDAPFHELSKYVLCFAVALRLTELALKKAICFLCPT